VSDPTQRLEASLGASVQAFAAGDLVAAAAAARDAEAACAELAAAGTRLRPDLLSRLLALHARGAAASQDALRQLHAEMGSLGRSRRAAAAYRGR
jgi:hypothetical protein